MNGWVEMTTTVPLIAPAASGPVFVVGFRYWNVSDPVVELGSQAIDDGSLNDAAGCGRGHVDAADLSVGDHVGIRVRARVREVGADRASR